MTRATCTRAACGREARYVWAEAIPTRVAYCSRHAQGVAHSGGTLLPIGTCGHVSTLADMVARRTCQDCRQAMDAPSVCKHCATLGVFRWAETYQAIGHAR